MTDKTQQATFADLGLIPTLVERLEALEYSQPTPIQSRSIPDILEGKDIMVVPIRGLVKPLLFRCQSCKKLFSKTNQTIAVATSFPT